MPPTMPSECTAIVATMIFVLWVVIAGALVSQRPELYRPWIIHSVSYGLLAIPLAVLIARDVYPRVRQWLRPKHQPSAGSSYSKNLSSTIMTICITMIIVPPLYCKLWHPGRIRTKIVFDEDTVNWAYFPSLTLFQKTDWTSQADLTTSASPKCFLERFDEEAPDCNRVTPGTLPCRCDGSWGESIEDFVWQNTTYRSLAFTATAAMQCLTPTTQMIAQAFFYYDSEKALADSSHVLSPSLSVAIYDPTLSLQEALESDYTRMVLVNANGMVQVNLGLALRQVNGKSPSYDYRLTISSIPAMNLTRDRSSSGNADYGPCFISLFLQFPTFGRRTSRLGPGLSWLEAASYITAWFGLFQLSGWISSGSAIRAS